MASPRDSRWVQNSGIISLIRLRRYPCKRWNVPNNFVLCVYKKYLFLSNNMLSIIFPRGLQQAKESSKTDCSRAKMSNIFIYVSMYFNTYSILDSTDILHIEGYEFQVQLFSMSIHLKITLPLGKTCGKSSHGVVIYGKDTYRKKVVFYLSALKPEVEMESEASRGRYDVDKPENITDLYRQSFGQLEKI